MSEPLSLACWATFFGREALGEELLDRWILREVGLLPSLVSHQSPRRPPATPLAPLRTNPSSPIPHDNRSADRDDPNPCKEIVKSTIPAGSIGGIASVPEA